jgi:hypothetical protein
MLTHKAIHGQSKCFCLPAGVNTWAFRNQGHGGGGTLHSAYQELAGICACCAACLQDCSSCLYRLAWVMNQTHVLM